MGQSVNKVAENILYQVFLTKDNTAHTQKHTHTKKPSNSNQFAFVSFNDYGE